MSDRNASPRAQLAKPFQALAMMALAVIGYFSGAQPGRAASPGLYNVKILPEMRVRMRDGVELAVLIIRPDAAGKFPAVVSYNPYREVGALQTALGGIDGAAGTGEAYRGATDLEAIIYMAARGYVFVVFDVRGTGNSGGSSADMYSDAERQDGYDMVEWAAKQSWCNRRVGMWGLSYGGVATWQVAAMAPPHLKAIIVNDGTDDVYGDFVYPGGAPRPNILGYFWTDFAPPTPTSTNTLDPDIWKERLKGNVPWPIGFLNHQTDDAYWRARALRPDYGRIKCAVFVTAGWSGWYASAVLRAFAALKVPKRALIGPWGHSWLSTALPGPRIDGRPEYLKWFDQHLKGLDTGSLTEPPITIFVNSYQTPAPMYKEQPGYWRHENEWPLARTNYHALYFGAHGRLSAAPGENESVERDSYTYRPSASEMSGIHATAWAMPLDQRQDEVYAQTYTSELLTNDLEITGTPTADLFVSSSADVAYFVVRLCDVAPDGTSKLISSAGLNATRRASHSRPEPLIPGKIYKLAFDLESVSYVFPAGHRIRVDVSSADFQNAWPVSKPATNTVVHGGQYPAHVTLPVVPAQNPPLPDPKLTPSMTSLPDTLTNPKHTITVTRDPVNQTATLVNSDSVHGMRYTVSDRNPADASLETNRDFVFPGPSGKIQVHMHTLLSSDAELFHYLAELDITEDGKPYFNNKWTASMRRVFN